MLPLHHLRETLAKKGNCQPIFARRAALFPTVADCENRWLYAFFANGGTEFGGPGGNRTHAWTGLQPAAFPAWLRVQKLGWQERIRTSIILINSQVSCR